MIYTVIRSLVICSVPSNTTNCFYLYSLELPLYTCITINMQCYIILISIYYVIFPSFLSSITWLLERGIPCLHPRGNKVTVRAPTTVLIHFDIGGHIAFKAEGQDCGPQCWIWT